jgi:hypothetical protein
VGSSPTRPPDPLTGRAIRFRKICKTERAAQGKLLVLAQAGRQPDSDVTGLSADDGTWSAVSSAGDVLARR